MKSQKICPQCDSPFEGRSNQIYCSQPCKQRSFHASKTDTIQNIITTDSQPYATSEDSVRTTDLRVERLYETLRLEGTERIKRLEIEERQQEREHELECEQQKREHELEVKRQEFERERERTKWEIESAKIKNPPIELPQPQESTRTKQHEESPDDEEVSSNVDVSMLILLGIGGLALAAMMKTKPSKKQSNSLMPSSTLDSFVERLSNSGKK